MLLPIPIHTQLQTGEGQRVLWAAEREGRKGRDGSLALSRRSIVGPLPLRKTKKSQKSSLWYSVPRVANPGSEVGSLPSQQLGKIEFIVKQGTSLSMQAANFHIPCGVTSLALQPERDV